MPAPVIPLVEAVAVGVQPLLVVLPVLLVPRLHRAGNRRRRFANGRVHKVTRLATAGASRARSGRLTTQPSPRAGAAEESGRKAGLAPPLIALQLGSGRVPDFGPRSRGMPFGPRDDPVSRCRVLCLDGGP